MSEAPRSQRQDRPPEASAAERALKFNTASATNMTQRAVERGGGYRHMFVLGLIQNDGSLDHKIDGPCDEDNRQMLDSVYRLAHADFDAATEEIDSRTSQAVIAVRVIPTSEGIEFVERFSQQPGDDGAIEEHFWVIAQPAGSYQEGLLPEAV